jgi:hypothetical protein
MDFLGFCKEFEADHLAASASMRASQEDDGTSTTNTTNDYLVPEAVSSQQQRDGGVGEGDGGDLNLPSSPDFASMMLSPKFSRSNAANKLLISVPSATMSSDTLLTPRSTVSFSSQHQQQTYHPSAPVATPKKQSSPVKREPQPSFLSTMSPEEKSEIRRLLSSDDNNASNHRQEISLTPLQRAAALKGKTFVSASVSSSDSSSMSIAPPPPPLLIPSSSSNSSSREGSPMKPTYGALGYSADELAMLGFSSHTGKWRGFPYDSYSCCHTSLYYCPKAPKPSKKNDHLTSSSISLRPSSTGKRRKTVEEKEEEDRKKTQERNRKLLDEYGGKDAYVNCELRKKFEELQQRNSINRHPRRPLSSTSSSSQPNVRSSSSHRSRPSSLSSPPRKSHHQSASSSSAKSSSSSYSSHRSLFPSSSSTTTAVVSRKTRDEKVINSRHLHTSIPPVPPQRVMSPDSASKFLFPSKNQPKGASSSSSSVSKQPSSRFNNDAIAEKKEKIKITSHPSSSALFSSSPSASPVPSTVKSPVKQYLSMLNDIRKDVLTMNSVPSAPAFLPSPPPVYASISPASSPLPPPPPPVTIPSSSSSLSFHPDSSNSSPIRKKTFIIHPPPLSSSSPTKHDTTISISRKDVESISKENAAAAVVDRGYKGEMEIKEEDDHSDLVIEGYCEASAKEREETMRKEEKKSHRVSHHPTVEPSTETEEEVPIMVNDEGRSSVFQTREEPVERSKKNQKQKKEEKEMSNKSVLLVHHQKEDKAVGDDNDVVNDNASYDYDFTRFGRVLPSFQLEQIATSSRVQLSRHPSSTNSNSMEQRERERVIEYRPISAQKRRSTSSSSQHSVVEHHPRSHYSVEPSLSLPPWIPSHSNPITNPSSNMVTKEAFKHRMKTMNKFKKEPSLSPARTMSRSYDQEEITHQLRLSNGRRSSSPSKRERERNSLSPSLSRRRTPSPKKVKQQENISITDRVDRLK